MWQVVRIADGAVLARVGSQAEAQQIVRRNKWFFFVVVRKG